MNQLIVGVDILLPVLITEEMRMNRLDIVFGYGACREQRLRIDMRSAARIEGDRFTQ